MFFCCTTTCEDRTVEPLFEADPYATMQPDVADSAFFMLPDTATTLLQHQNNHNLEDIHVHVPIKISAIPEPPSSEYEIIIEKNSQDATLGVDVETLGSMALILGISEGAVAKHNETARSEHQVRVGDFIVNVNGQYGDTKKILRALSAGSRLQMKMRRCVQFSIRIDKANYGTMGLDLDYLSNGTSLMIKAIKPGPVEDWNAANRNTQVNKEDRIISVNGTRGTAGELLSVCHESSVLDVQIVRPAPADDPLA